MLKFDNVHVFALMDGKIERTPRTTYHCFSFSEILNLLKSIGKFLFGVTDVDKLKSLISLIGTGIISCPTDLKGFMKFNTNKSNMHMYLPWIPFQYIKCGIFSGTAM